MSWRDLVFKAEAEPGGTGGNMPDPAPATPVRSSVPARTSAPIVISDMLSMGRVPVASTPVENVAAQAASSVVVSPQAQQLVERAMAAIPHENAMLQLMNTMQSMASIITDVHVRRQAAIAALKGQGVTEEKVAAGAKEAHHAVGGALDGVLTQIETMRGGALASKRAEAGSLRSEIEAIDRQIADLTGQRSRIETDIKLKEEEATGLEQKLDTMKSDVEVARQIASGSFSS